MSDAIIVIPDILRWDSQEVALVDALDAPLSARTLVTPYGWCRTARDRHWFYAGEIPVRVTRTGAAAAVMIYAGPWRYLAALPMYEGGRMSGATLAVAEGETHNLAGTTIRPLLTD